MIIIIGFITVFNGYKYMVFNDFKSYLNEKYQNKSFDLKRVKYDPLYEKFYAKVYCNDDRTEFSIFRQSDGTISENYWVTRNKMQMDKMIYACFEDEDVLDYIKSVSAGVGHGEILNTDKDLDYKKMADTIYICFYDHSIQNNECFAQIAHKIIQILKNNQVDFKLIAFTEERNDKVYELKLSGTEIDKEIEEMFKLIKRIK